MKKRLLSILMAAAMLGAICLTPALAAPPAVPTQESPDYTGAIIDYPDKELWFDSTVYGGFYSAYQIMAGNGDDTFDKVIDGDPNTFFDGLAEGWVEIDLGKKLKFDTLGFAPRAGYESRMTGGVFYGSNNGKDWKEIYTVKFSPASGINYIKLDKEQNYRYIRYEVPEGRAEGANEDYLCNIAEIELYREVE